MAKNGAHACERHAHDCQPANTSHDIDPVVTMQVGTRPRYKPYTPSRRAILFNVFQTPPEEPQSSARVIRARTTSNGYVTHWPTMPAEAAQAPRYTGSIESNSLSAGVSCAIQIVQNGRIGRHSWAKRTCSSFV